MLEGLLSNLAILSNATALIQIFGTALFCAIFLFLWRQSQVTYFSYWSLAWAIESVALATGLLFPAVPCLGGVLEFCFALALLIAGRSALAAPPRGAHALLRSTVLFPGLLLLVYVFGWRLPAGEFRALHSAILALIFGYSFVTIGVGSVPRKGIGSTLFRFSLGCLFVQFSIQAVLYFRGALPAGWFDIYALAPQTLLAFSAMAMWIQNLQQLVELQQQTIPSDRDPLTGLQNRKALDQQLDEAFQGVVAVCDLDYFKDINDRFGHLAGDDVLRSVGQLIRASIRVEDRAFRWGGDEFVILFRDQSLELIRGRMAALEQRLTTFRIRGDGLFPLGLSWGTAEAKDQLPRPVLEAADRQMYECKRQAHLKAQR